MDILILIETHLLKLGLELVPTLPALVPSILLLFEENDETIKMKALSIIDGIIGVATSH